MTSLIGLSEDEALARRLRGLGNTMPPATGRTYRQIARENILTFINAVIFSLAIALLLLGQWSDALVSVGVVGVNVLVGLVQEMRAKRVLDRIALLNRPRATVLRDATVRDIAPDDIVVGDLVVARAGDQILVDGPLRDGHMEVDESLLTGEADLVPKRPGDDLRSGTFCVTGGGAYEAVAVGEASLADRITVGARAFRRVYTPLQRQVQLVVRVIVLVAVSFGVVLVIAAILDGLPPVDIVRIAVVVAGLVPNGLFLAIASAYAIGAVRIAGQKVLVQQANAVESLSNVDTLCLDKTGTLTSGRIVVEDVLALDGAPAEARSRLGDYVASEVSRNRTSEPIAAVCPGRRRALSADVPFSSSRRWSAMTFADTGDSFVLGAPDVLRNGIDASHGDRVDREVGDATSKGLRVLLFARAAAPIREPALLCGLVPVALVTLRDELRREARETCAEFARGGVALKLVSGDHPDTVRRLALLAGLPAGGHVVTGAELEAADEAALARLAAEQVIFARVAPHAKERLVAALRAQGHYVAMVGDGVNDVPALKRANLAIALRSGSQATRAVADLVLLDDSFTSLPRAFREGQRILQGMQNVLRLFLTRVSYVALLILATALVEAGFPYTPKQNALLTFLTVGVPTIALAFFARPAPLPRDQLARSLFHFVLPAASSVALAGLVVYLAALVLGGEDAARSALTTFSILAGLILILFAGPPTRWWTAADAELAGWRPAVLVVLLGGGFAWLLADVERRAFFDLAQLPFVAHLLVLPVVAGWALALRWVWRTRLVERLLGIGPSEA